MELDTISPDKVKVDLIGLEEKIDNWSPDKEMNRTILNRSNILYISAMTDTSENGSAKIAQMLRNKTRIDLETLKKFRKDLEFNREWAKMFTLLARWNDEMYTWYYAKVKDNSKKFFKDFYSGILEKDGKTLNRLKEFVLKKGEETLFVHFTIKNMFCLTFSYLNTFFEFAEDEELWSKTELKLETRAPSNLNEDYEECIKVNYEILSCILDIKDFSDRQQVEERFKELSDNLAKIAA